MTTFVVNAWSHSGDPTDMEANVPLLFNGRRMNQLGIKNRITVVFLKGYHRLPDSYKAELKELAYDVVDAEAVTTELEQRVPVLIDSFQTWGGIQHFCILRWMVMRKLFGNEGIITFDGDMVINTDLDTIEEALGQQFYLLDGSTCFVSIPSGHDFLQAFEENAFLWNDDPVAFNQKFFQLENPNDVFAPTKIGGSDQALGVMLLRRQVVSMGNGCGALEAKGIYGFPNWLLVKSSTGMPIQYERRDGVDYLGGKKVLISHLSTDACTYFGAFIYLRDYLGVKDPGILGKIPLPFHHYSNAENSPLRNFLLSTRSAFMHFKDLDQIGSNPFNRMAVINTFYRDGDFSPVFNDRIWHQEGIFA